MLKTTWQWTYKQREGLLELGDLLLGKWIGLRSASSSAQSTACKQRLSAAGFRKPSMGTDHVVGESKEAPVAKSQIMSQYGTSRCVESSVGGGRLGNKLHNPFCDVGNDPFLLLKDEGWCSWNLESSRGRRGGPGAAGSDTDKPMQRNAWALGGSLPPSPPHWKSLGSAALPSLWRWRPPLWLPHQASTITTVLSSSCSSVHVIDTSALTDW